MFFVLLASTAVAFSSTYALSEHKYQGYLSKQAKYQLLAAGMICVGAML